MDGCVPTVLRSHHGDVTFKWQHHAGDSELKTFPGLQADGGARQIGRPCKGHTGQRVLPVGLRPGDYGKYRTEERVCWTADRPIGSCWQLDLHCAGVFDGRFVCYGVTNHVRWSVNRIQCHAERQHYWDIIFTRDCTPTLPAARQAPGLLLMFLNEI
jgi:hypothetical protein